MYRLSFETQSNGTFPAVKPRSTSLKVNDATTAAPPCDVPWKWQHWLQISQLWQQYLILYWVIIYLFLVYKIICNYYDKASIYKLYWQCNSKWDQTVRYSNSTVLYVQRIDSYWQQTNLNTAKEGRNVMWNWGVFAADSWYCCCCTTVPTWRDWGRTDDLAVKGRRSNYTALV